MARVGWFSHESARDLLSCVSVLVCPWGKCSNAPCPVERVCVSPRHKGLLAVKQQYLHAHIHRWCPAQLAQRDHLVVHLREVFVDTPRHVHKHRARCRAVRRADEALGRELAVEVRDEGQDVGLPRPRPRRLPLEYYVVERYVPGPRRGRLGGRVLPLGRPLGQLPLEEVDEVLLDLGRALRPRDARDEDRGEQRATVDVEVVAWARHGAQEAVGERRVGGCRHEQQEEGQHREKVAQAGQPFHVRERRRGWDRAVVIMLGRRWVARLCELDSTKSDSLDQFHKVQSDGCTGQLQLSG